MIKKLKKYIHRKQPKELTKLIRWIYVDTNPSKKSVQIFLALQIGIIVIIGAAAIFLGAASVIKQRFFPYPQINKLEQEKLRQAEDRQILSNLAEFHPWNISCADAASRYPIFTLSNAKTLTINGSHAIPETIVIPHNCTVVIQPGTKLYFAPHTSFISYGRVQAIGNKKAPILLSSQNASSPWGVFAVIRARKQSNFSHIIIERGSEATVNNISFTGALSLYHTNTIIDNATIRFNHGDDGINAKFGTIVVQNSTFTENGFDGLDIDVAEKAAVTNNVFISNGNDGVDISFSKVTIQNNSIELSGDKCISIGEKSQSDIVKNTLTSCPIGIAVKDSSIARILSNHIAKTGVAISVYNKKGIFSGGAAMLSNNQFVNNKNDMQTDQLSTIENL